MKTILRTAVAGLSLLAAQPALATWCSDKPTSIILHENQYIYFTTETVCTNWCLVTPGWTQAQQDRVFATILSAINTGGPIGLFMPNGCSAVATYAQPTIIVAQRP